MKRLSALPRRRSLLYVPAHQPRFVEGAHLRGADVIILDLEDGVPADAKEEARAALKNAVPRVTAGGAEAFVRINKPFSLAWRDVEAAVNAGASALLLPKVEDACHVSVISSYLDELDLNELDDERGDKRRTETAADGVGLVVLIESARGLGRVKDVAAASARLQALIPGNEDLATDLGVKLEPERTLHLYPPLLLAARAEGLSLYGTLGGSADFGDMDAYKKRVTLSRDWGFDGATCIHPSQVGIINDVYQPNAAELWEARRIVETFEAGGGNPVALEGKMIDRPIYLRAKRVLRQGGESP